LFAVADVQRLFSVEIKPSAVNATPLFAVADVQRLTAKRERTPTWRRFDSACRSQGADPVRVLCQFVQNSQFDSFDGKRADLDLFHAGIRRTLESNGAFVGAMLGKGKWESEYDRQLAAMLGREPLDEAKRNYQTAMSCREFWGHLRRHANQIFGHNMTVALRTEQKEKPVYAFDRSHVINTVKTSVSRLAFRPRYLIGFRGSKPSWVHDSVARPDRQTRTFYATAERDLGIAIWQWSNGKPAPQRTADFLYAMASARSGDFDEAVKMLVGLGVKRISALALAEAWQRAGQLTRSGFDRATINRVFCQSRAAAITKPRERLRPSRSAAPPCCEYCGKPVSKPHRDGAFCSNECSDRAFIDQSQTS
jgi:hypothetical protein